MSITNILKYSALMAGDSVRRPLLMRIHVSYRYASKKTPSPCQDQSTLKPLTIADRTINLAKKPNYTEKPKKCPPPPPPLYCPKPEAMPDRRPPVVRPIKVCSTEDLKKMCGPKPCTPKPPADPPETWAAKALRMALFLVKAAIAGGLVYWTIDIGLWGEQDDTMEIYRSIHTAIAEMFKDVPKVDVPQIPRTDEMFHEAEQNWNRGVMYVLTNIARAPNKILVVFGLAKKEEDCEPVQQKPVVIKPDPKMSLEEKDC